MSEKRLRLQGFLVKPVCVWDDGDELTSGPQMDAMELSPSDLEDFASSWRDHWAAFIAQHQQNA